jgi:putative tryptophan/tyrosine transport system substrate-binding protein
MKRRAFITLLGGAASTTICWPLAARAQQPAMPVIGFLHGQRAQGYAGLFAVFRQGVSDAGLVESENVVIESRWAENHPDQLPVLAADLVRRNVAVIATAGGDVATYAARNATNSIPIAFIIGGDPVSTGLASRLGRPGGNATGVTMITAALELKRLELLREAIPTLDEIGILANRSNPRFTVDTNVVQTVGQAIGLKTALFAAENESDLDAFARMSQRQIGGVLALSDPFFNSSRNHLVTLAAKYKLPAIYHVRELPVAGGLMSYGASLPHLYRQLGVLAGKIAKGARPSEIPIEQPTKFELVLNLKAAKALGLEIPPTLLARADEVIE